jgi:site-specific DNA recombinase
VHKIDRLARNRSDDVTIMAAIVASGARLVSVTENIDETPSGLLLHGIMSSIAEFYSRNLAAEVRKGVQQKFKTGGTVTLAPPGYLNVRRLVDGYEVRTVKIDQERANHIRWAFEAYATGDWTLNSLAAELATRGLRQRATRTRLAKPFPANKLHEILRNRYYLGYVSYRGVENEGKHEQLIDAETFEAVQRVLAEHRTSGERSYRRQHYLTGSLTCGRCGSRMGYSVSTGKGGAEYGYFFCLGRHSGRTECRLRYLPAHLVEQAVVDVWRLDRRSAQQSADRLRHGCRPSRRRTRRSQTPRRSDQAGSNSLG